MSNNRISDELVEKVAQHFYPALNFPLPPVSLKTVYADVRSFLEAVWPEPTFTLDEIELLLSQPGVVRKGLRYKLEVMRDQQKKEDVMCCINAAGNDAMYVYTYSDSQELLLRVIELADEPTLSRYGQRFLTSPRYGQRLFDALYNIDPPTANTIRNTKADPFYGGDDESQRIANFFRAILDKEYRDGLSSST